MSQANGRNIDINNSELVSLSTAAFIDMFL